MKPEEIIQESIDELSPLFSTNTWFKEYTKLHQKRFAKELAYLIEIIPPGEIIGEFGAAPFVLTLALKKLGYQIEAWDIAPERVSKIPGIEVKKSDLDNWDINENEKYHCIIFMELFEHLRGNLIVTMEGVLRLLKPGGKVLLSTPNLYSFMGIYKFIFKGIAYSSSSDIYHEWNKIREHGHMGHVREYTVKEMRDFFKKIGFDIEKIVRRPQNMGDGWKNKLFYLLERLIPRLSSNVLFILKKQS